MINVEHELSLTRQAELLSLSRASLYYTPVEVSDANLRLMKRIDELHLELPFAGSRMLRDLLNGEGIEVGRKHVASKVSSRLHQRHDFKVVGARVSGRVAGRRRERAVD